MAAEQMKKKKNHFSNPIQRQGKYQWLKVNTGGEATGGEATGGPPSMDGTTAGLSDNTGVLYERRTAILPPIKEKFSYHVLIYIYNI